MEAPFPSPWDLIFQRVQSMSSLRSEMAQSPELAVGLPVAEPALIESVHQGDGRFVLRYYARRLHSQVVLAYTLSVLGLLVGAVLGYTVGVLTGLGVCGFTVGALSFAMERIPRLFVPGKLLKEETKEYPFEYCYLPGESYRADAALPL